MLPSLIWACVCTRLASKDCICNPTGVMSTPEPSMRGNKSDVGRDGAEQFAHQGVAVAVVERHALQRRDQVVDFLVVLLEVADQGFVDAAHRRIEDRFLQPRVHVQGLQDLGPGLLFHLLAVAVEIPVGQRAHHVVVADQCLDRLVDRKRACCFVACHTILPLVFALWRRRPAAAMAFQASTGNG